MTTHHDGWRCLRRGETLCGELFPETQFDACTDSREEAVNCPRCRTILADCEASGAVQREPYEGAYGKRRLVMWTTIPALEAVLMRHGVLPYRALPTPV